MRKKMFLLLVFISFLLVGCNEVKQSDAENVEIEFWTTTGGEETEALLQLVDQFHEEHSHIQVNVVETDFNTTLNDFKASTLADTQPDIIRADISWTTELADLGTLLNLNHLLTDNDQEDYIESAFRYNFYQDNIYGIPMVTDAPALLYNREMLATAGYQSAPETMDELMEIAIKISEEDNKYGIFINNDSYYSLPYIWAFGGGMITDDNNIEIATQDSIAGIEFMMELIEKDAAQPSLNFDNAYETMMTDFKEGRAAMILNGPWATTDILDGPAFEDPANFGIAAIPKGPGGQGSPTGGQSLVISSYTDFPEESYTFIEFINTVESQLFMANEVGTLPTRTSAYNDNELQQNSMFQGFKSQLDVAQTRPVIPESSWLFGDFTTSLTDILLRNVKPEQGMKKVEEDWDYLIH